MRAAARQWLAEDAVVEEAAQHIVNAHIKGQKNEDALQPEVGEEAGGVGTHNGPHGHASQFYATSCQSTMTPWSIRVVMPVIMLTSTAKAEVPAARYMGS